MSVTPTTKYNIKEWIDSGIKAQNIQTNRISVPVSTLDQILQLDNRGKKINLLVIDVEGSEEEVLKGFNLEKYSPIYILVEIHNEELKKSIERIIKSKYSLLGKIADADYLYKLIQDK